MTASYPNINIVVLDTQPLSQDGIDFSSLAALGTLKTYAQTKDSEVVERAKDATIVLTNKVKLNESHFAQLPLLRYIAITATGVDNIDIDAARKHNIVVQNVEDYATASVAQQVFAFILDHCNQVALHNAWVQKGGWESAPSFSAWLRPIQELKGKTIGLIGFGKIAQQVAKIALAFDMKVLAYRPNAFSHPEVLCVPLLALWQQSDIVSLHCPLTPETKSLVNEENLSLMKAGSLLINTGRGGLIDEKALAKALKEGRLSAAYLDVLSEEPPQPSHPLLHLSNCILTPHMAWASLEARRTLVSQLYRQIDHFLQQFLS